MTSTVPTNERDIRIDMALALVGMTFIAWVLYLIFIRQSECSMMPISSTVNIFGECVVP